MSDMWIAWFSSAFVLCMSKALHIAHHLVAIDAQNSKWHHLDSIVNSPNLAERHHIILYDKCSIWHNMKTNCCSLIANSTNYPVHSQWAKNGRSCHHRTSNIFTCTRNCIYPAISDEKKKELETSIYFNKYK